MTQKQMIKRQQLQSWAHRFIQDMKDGIVERGCEWAYRQFSNADLLVRRIESGWEYSMATYDGSHTVNTNDSLRVADKLAEVL